MVALRHLQTAFLSGELDPLLSGRVDTDHYGFGLEKCENFVPTNEGPIVKRPGFEYIVDADETADWLGAFRFNVTQEYVIEWGELKARFFTNGARIETSPGVAYELATPYEATQASRLCLQQSFDRLNIDHPAHPPAFILRTDAVNFSYGVTELLNGPFLDANRDELLQVIASAAEGNGISLNASAGIFAAGHVGALFRMEAADYSTVKAWEAGMKNVAIGEKVRSDGKVYIAQTSGTTGTNPPIHTEGAEWDGQFKTDINDEGPYGILWRYLHDRFGVVRIVAISGPPGIGALLDRAGAAILDRAGAAIFARIFADGPGTVTADVVRRLPDQVVSAATHRWAHQAFSEAEGWPSLVVHWNSRQVHIKSFDVIASVVGDFGGGRVNFQAFTSSGLQAADLAFRRTLAISDPPLWAVDDRNLLLGSASREIQVGPVNTQLAVAGDNIEAKPQSKYGSEPVWPEQVGTQTVFVERGGRRLRASDYDFGRDRYVPDDLTAAARNISKSGVIQLAFQRIPFALLYGVRRDGQLIVHPNTKLEIKGFARTVLGGGAAALSAVSVIGADGVTDELWLLVERERHDGIRREIWKQAPWRELGAPLAEAFYVDCGASIAAAGGQKDFTGATHLSGQTIVALAGGAVIRDIQVDVAGKFSLPEAFVPAEAYTLTIGLPYTAEAVTLQPPARTRAGSIQGLRQRARKIMLRLLETLGIEVGGFGKRLANLIDKPGGATMDQALAPVTGDRSAPIETEIGHDGRTRYVSSDPLPAIITAAATTLEVDEGDA